MIHSMTAFGRDQSDTPLGRLIWELRSVNHRFLEISIRVPEDMRMLETEIRKEVGKHMKRGKIDCNLRLQSEAGITNEIEVDKEIVQQILSIVDSIRSGNASVAPINAAEILKWPGVLKSPVTDIGNVSKFVMEGFSRALNEMVETRAREGAELVQAVEERLTNAQTLITEIKTVIPEVTQAFRQRLQDRLKDIKQELDPARLEQEILILANKSDVDEELDRLQTHIGEVRRVLSQGGSVGRRLDFLMQEFNREANTIGSKATDVRVTNASVELKVNIEQMREQVQNIE